MRSLRPSIVRGSIAGAMFLSCLAQAWATPPSSPITLTMKLATMDPAAASGEVVIDVVSSADAPATNLDLILPPGAEADQTHWSLDLRAGRAATFISIVKWDAVAQTGNLSISARANRPIDATNSWGDMKTIPLHLDGATGFTTEGWTVAQVPVAGLAQAGDALIISMEPTPFSWAQSRAEALPAVMPSVEAQRPGSQLPVPQPGAQTVTITGHWDYQDRSGVSRAIDQQLIELRTGAGGQLSPRAFCFTDVNGDFSCGGNHPGTTLRVWVWSWTNLNPGPTRLGVFSGPEVSGGCGNENLDCAYPVQTGEIGCADGTTCNIGSWFLSNGVEPWGGAHQMTQDLIRSFKKILFDGTRHGNFPGFGLPARINYPVPGSHGTHAHVGNGETDGRISIPPPNQTAADVVTHEYGHTVMSNLWTGFTTKWPINDCPSPHFVNGVSAAGCALSEGFADYWSWYSDEFYDGDNSTANDGAVYNDPGFSVDFETRSGFTSGDTTEGNVAAVMGDWMDSANDGGAPGSGLAGDHMTDGVGHIWHVLSSQGNNQMSDWWATYWSTFGHDPGFANEILFLDTINYGWTINDVCIDSKVVPFVPYTDFVASNVAYTDSTDPGVTCGNGSRGKSVFYTYTSPAWGTIDVNTLGSNYDTILSAYTGGCGGFANVDCNDDIAPPARHSQLSLAVRPGVTYTFMVSAYANNGGVLQFNLGFTPTPAPFNDNCASAYIVPSYPFSDAQFTGNATVQGGDPAAACGNGSNGKSAWYRFTAPSAGGTLQIDTSGSDYDTILSTFSGVCGGFADWPGGCNDDSFGTRQSYLSLPMAGGRTIYIMASAYGNDGGNLSFHLNFFPNSGTVPDGSFSPGPPLDVTDAGGGLLNLSWGSSCQPTDTDYEIYEGVIGSWYSHYAWYCGTGGATSYTIVTSSGNTYYLVVPRTASFEGSYGVDSSGSERPASAIFQCAPQAMGGCPPNCAHDKCVDGSPLDPACNGCVANICAVDPYCCAFGFDAFCVSEVRTVCGSLICSSSAGTCAHSQCAEGGPLTGGCDNPPVNPSCVDTICAADAYCCLIGWDATCVGEVGTFCGYTCN